MTLAGAIDRTLRLSRTSSSSHDNTAVMERINDGQKAFAKAVHGLTTEAYITLAPKFDIETNFALRITITAGTNALVATDVALCTTAALDQTGTQVATALQVTLRAAIGAGNATVTWSTTEWKFTIDTIDGTAITIAAPSGITYVDATELLGLSGTVTETDASMTGDIPTDCTIEADLPANFLSMTTQVEWDGNKLSPGYFGTPRYYGIRNGKIRLCPAPSSQKMFHIFYKYIPQDFTAVQGYQEVGLTGKTGLMETGLAGATQYYWKVAIDGDTSVEYDITTVADTTYDAVIALMNAAITRATWSLEEGDLRCTSDTLDSSSAIALAAGTSGPNLFATLTGWAVFDTAVATDAGDSLDAEDEYVLAVCYYAASMLAEENFEYDRSDRLFAQYKRITKEHIVHHANNNPKLFPSYQPAQLPEVDI